MASKRKVLMSLLVQKQIECADDDEAEERAVDKAVEDLEKQKFEVTVESIEPADDEDDEDDDDEEDEEEPEEEDEAGE